jgi:hypothetical protein
MMAMEIIVIGALFFGIVAGGLVLAATLIVSALRADQRYLDEFEGPGDTDTSEPAWVKREPATT